jgi:protein-tyrosine phosphatase
MNRVARVLKATALMVAATMFTACSAPTHTPIVNLGGLNHGATDNFRDIAGPGAGYVVLAGHIRHGQVFRSNFLAFSPTESDYVEGLNITEVFDLRTPPEIAAHPDVLPRGATYTPIDVLGDAAEGLTGLANGSTRPQSASEANAIIERVYRTLAGGDHQRRAYGELLTDIANANGPVIIHCTAGKDRSGWATALLQTVAGVSRDDIFDNYLLSNDYSKKSVTAKLDKIKNSAGPAAAEAMEPLLGVHRSYLNAAFDEANRDYGEMRTYLTAGLGLPPSTLAALRAKLVVNS